MGTIFVFIVGMVVGTIFHQPLGKLLAYGIARIRGKGSRGGAEE
jgi:hypothetical protein